MTRAAASTNRRRRLAPAARRATIIAAAAPLFASLGYEHTRVSDIAARVGVTEPVVFQNFGTKAELFSAVLDAAAREAAVQLGLLADEADDALELLEHLLSAEHLDWMHSSHTFGLLFHDAHRPRPEHIFGEALQRALDSIARGFTRIVQHGQAQGSIRADVAARTLAWLLLSLVHARQFRREHALEGAAALEADLLRSVIDVLRPPAS
jgi:AcrR family transcriptional regulator